MTHDELMADVDLSLEWSCPNDIKSWEIIRAVVQLHHPWELENGLGVRCSFCVGYDYPCPTIQIIKKEN